ncbi:MAG: TIGR01212 family radical SAM protein [Peptostreptococcaceae bacterium]|nr:TIGR01212 family radical SAM protein [Peptostreptococcaceae bacterium]
MRNKLFYSINDVLRERFGTKIIKLSLDGGFSCPNRDGSKGNGGCIFCSDAGSGEFAGSRKHSIQKQAQSQVELLRSKWKDAGYIAYFQNFTNTYASVDHLRTLYDEALAVEGVVGLAIATRPDCLDEDVLNLLQEYNKKTFLWVELGLQSIHKKTADLIRRGYDLPVFDQAIKQLNARHLKSVVHLILNLPNENFSDMENSLRYVCDAGVWGIKLQMLNILHRTDMALYYEKSPFYLRTADEYIELVSHLLTKAPADIVIHRLTGDGDKKSLIAPRWVLNKRYVLNGIQKYMREHGMYQGKFHDDIS